MTVSAAKLAEESKSGFDVIKEDETPAGIKAWKAFLLRPREINAQVSGDEGHLLASTGIGYLVCRVAEEMIELAPGTGDFMVNQPFECFYVHPDSGATHGRRVVFNGPLVKSFIPQEITDRLEYLARLPENWDGDGIGKVTQYTINRAKSVLEVAFATVEGPLPIPFISPAYDGMLVAEWRTAAGKELIIDIPTSPDDSPGFLLVEPQPSGEELETDAEIGDAWSIQKVISRLVAN